MKLSQWMMMEWLPRDMAAEKYVVGQNLTKDQAAEIVRIIAHSVNFKADKRQERKNLHVVGSPYRDFVTSIVLLMCAGKKNKKWGEMIWDALDPGLQNACQTVMIGKIMGK